MSLDAVDPQASSQFGLSTREDQAEGQDYIQACIQAVQEHEQKRTNGRPSVMTPHRLRRLFSALERGNFRETACAYARIGWTTFKTWMAEGEGDDAIETAYGKFRAAVEFAESIPEMAASDRIQAAGKANPRFYMADVIWLSRARRKHWSDTAQAPQQNNFNVAIGLQLSVATPAIPLSPAAQSPSALSPSTEIVVSGELTEAKATPNVGVSPPSVA